MRSKDNNFYKFKQKCLQLAILTCVILPSYAAEYSSNPEPVSNTGEDATAKYLKSLGGYLGYDLTQDMALPDTMLNYTLNVIASSSTGQNILYAMLRAIPMNAAFPMFFTGTTYDNWNAQTANTLFQGYGGSTSSTSNSISATEQFDQETWQNDPVSQAVLNMVGTPDLNACPENKTSSSESSCLSSYQVMLTTLSSVLDEDGELPGEDEYMKYSSSTSKFISQLNSDNLLGPIVYSTSNANKDAFPSGSQLQQAQAFVRYATEGVLPLPTMSPSDYGKLRALAYPPKDSSGNVNSKIDIENMNNAKIALASYLLNLRVYAAKSSVAIGNLYGMLAKRMPQTVPDGNGGNSTTSQAVNELQMATWRLYNPATKSANDQWAQQINSAAPSTIQKEMAILLSEINYQLYLNRQQQERLLLTNSMILMQLLSLGKPSKDFPNSVSQEADKAPDEASS